jgi:flagellar biosynthesis/type III secretory pathway protein FliH
MKQKTAIRQLIEKLEVFLKEHRSNDLDEGLMLAIELAEELESVNEQQIKDGFNQGYREGESASELMDMYDGDVSQFQDADIYFNQTFEKP